MLGRQRSGAVICRACGKLVGANDTACASCGARYPGLWGFAPLLRRLGQDLGFTELVIGGSVLLYVLTLVKGGIAPAGGGLFSFLSPSPSSLFLFGASGPLPVFQYGRWWTILSAGWLHGSLLHILFNLLWVRQLAPLAAEVYGAGRMVIIYALSSVCGFALSSVAIFFPSVLTFLLGGGSFTVGASAAIFGLLGAMVWAGRRGASIHLGRQAWIYAVVLFLFGFLMRGVVDNWAHLGGFAGGYLLGMWLNPYKPERLDHLVGALLCLVLSAAAVVASVVTGARLVQ